MYQRLVFVLPILLLFAVGCTTQEPSVAAAEVEAATVSIRLPWVHTAEYAGFYVAENEGYYAEENIEIEYVNDDVYTVNVLDAVSEGEVQFGVITADQLVIHANEQDNDLVAVMTLYQRNPIAFISLADSNITTPKDWIGKSVMVFEGGTTSFAYAAILSTQGIDPSDVNFVPRTDFSNDLLISGEVDVMDAFVTNQPVQLELAGYEVNIMLASDYGIDMYPNVIIAKRETIENNPELVTRFVRATVKGLQAAVDNPEQAAELVLEINPELSLESESLSMLRSVPLINPAGSRPGMMDKKGWANIVDTLVEQDIVDSDIDMSSVFTLDFLDAVYQSED